MNNTQKELNLQDFKQSISFLFEMQSKCFNHCVKSYENMDLNSGELECVNSCA
jgi:hypothetical protein